MTTEAERATVTPATARRLADLVTAVWAIFDQIAAASPAELRKGPRGGGRDRDQLIGHVIGAETAYVRKLQIKLKQPAIGHVAATEELRAAIATVVGASSDGFTLGARRLDHALRGAPDRLARARTCLGDAGSSRDPGGPAGADRLGLAVGLYEPGAIPRAELDHGPADVGRADS